MGYGLPAAVGVQLAHPQSLVIDIGGDASVQMTMQEMSTAIQYGLPIKIFILNNEWMGMVRQWQQLLHGERYSHTYYNDGWIAAQGFDLGAHEQALEAFIEKGEPLV